jgi:hypothetical protein
MPVASWRVPGGGSSVVSTSAIRVLLVGSQIDPHRQLGDPGGHDPLDLVLPDPEISDPTLIQQLDRARVKTAGP